MPLKRLLAKTSVIMDDQFWTQKASVKSIEISNIFWDKILHNCEILLPLKIVTRFKKWNNINKYKEYSEFLSIIKHICYLQNTLEIKKHSTWNLEQATCMSGGGLQLGWVCQGVRVLPLELQLLEVSIYDFILQFWY